MGNEKGVVKEGRIHIEKEINSYCDLSKYGFDNDERVTEKEWNEVLSYLEGVANFWKDIKPVE